ncbi:MAG: sulfotransferase domain-containing protein [Sulfurovaceae bacterium]|nr:sulfotransferase domain-containing protein [Sulfurovaceae bacterium]
MKIFNYLKGNEFNHSKNFLLKNKLIKQIILLILKNIHLHQKLQDNDIFIFSSFRSGSTWLAELLATCKGYKLVNEPLSPYKFELEKNIVPIKPAQVYFKIDKKLLTYFNNLSLGKALLSHRYDILSSSHSFITHRTIFKLLRATPILDELYTNIDMKPILLIRHPIASAFSKIQSGIFVVDRDLEFLNNNTYVNKFLTQEQLKFSHKIITKNDEFERGILEWCLDNIPLFNFYKDKTKQSLFLTYEELTLYPKEIIEYISTIYNITDTTHILNFIYKASAAAGSYSDVKTINMIKNKDNRIKLINKWKKEITIEKISSALKIIKVFNIDVYNENIIANKKYLILGNNL